MTGKLIAPPLPAQTTVLGNATIHFGKSEQVLATYADNSIDAIVTDPPYGLANTSQKKVTETLGCWLAGERDYGPRGAGFMGAAWDSFVPPPAAWDEALRVLKPGGHMTVFAGARTHGLMEMSLRLAGFEIREPLAWARGYGMQKTADLAKEMSKAGIDGAEEWAGWSGTLKPAIEPILLARKPLEGPLIRNVAKWGTGALHNGANRVPHRNAADLAESMGKNRHADFGTQSGANSVYGDYGMLGARGNYDPSAGRLPTNLILDSHQAEQVDAKSGPHPTSDEIGGASRFFHVIDQQLDDLDTRLIYTARASAKERPVVDGVQHTTVKPLALMRHLISLITPPGGTVLDMFAGSGTTAEAALELGFKTVAIEAHAPHVPLIEHRVRRALGLLELSGQGAEPARA